MKPWHLSAYQDLLDIYKYDFHAIIKITVLASHKYERGLNRAILSTWHGAKDTS